MIRKGVLHAVALVVPLFAIGALLTEVDNDPDPFAVHAVDQTPLSRLPLRQTEEQPATFPLRVSANRRYLQDSAGQPFLIKGEAAWSLIAELKRDDVELYLRDRRSRGFNTLLVSLIERRFATNAPANAYGDLPFQAPGRFDRPNEAYFEFAEWVLRRAEAEGFLVLLTPCYTGSQGGNEGWYQEMVASGPENLREYGRHVGARYRHLKNIIWVANGDFDAPNQDVVRAVVEGIREANPRALFTSHNGNGTAAIDYWPGEKWVQLNNVYTWGPVYPPSKVQYLRKPTLPYFLMEGQYENQPHISTQLLRSQAYQALLTGAAGHVFGNSPIWYFSSPIGSAEYPAPPSWRAELDGAGSRSMARLHELFAALPWTRLEPDVSGELLVDGRGDGLGSAVAALNRDRSMAIVYVPDDRRITLDMSRLAGTKVRAFWFDPAAGRTFPTMGSDLKTLGSETFRALKRNASGASDWVLILQTDG